MREREARLQQRVHVGLDGAVILDDAVDEPARVAPPLLPVAVDGPVLLVAVVAAHPAVRVRGADRMLDREHESAVRAQRVVDPRDDACVVLDVMQRERRHDEIERARRRVIGLDRPLQIGDGAVVGARARLLEHPRRHVDGRHRRRAVRARVAGEIAEAAAEVEHVQARQVRQQTLHRGRFERAVQAGVALPKRAIAFEERCVVVDVLRRGLRRRVGIAAHDGRSLT
ncbi:hypothetical protein Y033_5357 [Burkholderia pseudomallei MSHR435]|nr:hypothetical protein Y033_5357 [Burkholderia pseudomallei MSHR435]